jgi:hypothetical protein
MTVERKQIMVAGYTGQQGDFLKRSLTDHCARWPIRRVGRTQMQQIEIGSLS